MHNVDTEKMLQWALREELPKGHPVAASAWETTVERYAFLGTRVDVSHGSPDGLGFVPGEPHPDAVMVGDAIRALPRDYKLPFTDCCAVLGHFAVLDRLALRAVANAEFNMPALIIRCAVLGQRMPFDIGHPRIEPSLRYDRQRWAVAFYTADDGLVHEAKANNRGNYPHGAHTPLQWCEPSIGSMLETRTEYAIWQRALWMIYEALRGRLSEHEIAPPLAAPEPWRTGQTPEPVVRTLKRDRAAPAGVLPLKPTRERALPPLEPDMVRKMRQDRARDAAEARKERTRRNAASARPYRGSAL